MRSIWAGVGLGCVIVLTIAGGLIHGRLSNRWGQSADMTVAAEWLDRVPNQTGSWQLQSTGKLEESAQKMLQCAGHFVRTYVDPITGSAINVTVLMGPTGPTSEHIPEICFSTQNFQVLGARHAVDLRDSSGQQHQLWQVDFQSRDLEPRLVRTFYAWSTGNAWQASENPRFEFVKNPYLYKIQLVEYPPQQVTQQSTSAVPGFLSDFLPLVAGALRPPSEN